MSFHNNPDYQIPELIEALKAHRLPHDTPSQLADSFRSGWMACRELAQADNVTAPAVHSQTYEMLLKAAGTALEVLQKHRQMKGDWPVGELGRRAAEELQAARDASFNADSEDPAQLADNAQEDAAWMPLTPELLTAIESGDLGNRFWIAAHNSNEPQIGVYEWRQGRNPHGFNSDLSRYGASEITHVLPYKPPALPAASSPQARRKP